MHEMHEVATETDNELSTIDCSDVRRGKKFPAVDEPSLAAVRKNKDIPVHLRRRCENKRAHQSNSTRAILPSNASAFVY